MFPKLKVESPQVLEPEKAQLPGKTRRGTQAPFVSSMAKSEPGTCSLETGDRTGAGAIERGGGPGGSGEKRWLPQQGQAPETSRDLGSGLQRVRDDPHGSGPQRKEC